MDLNDELKINTKIVNLVVDGKKEEGYESKNYPKLMPVKTTEIDRPQTYEEWRLHIRAENKKMA